MRSVFNILAAIALFSLPLFCTSCAVSLEIDEPGAGDVIDDPDDGDTGQDEPDGLPPIDADGDGFTDEVELNGEPATNPDDPQDNPNQAIDNDGDGCSDFEEIEFVGFCDGDSNTPITSIDLDADGVDDLADNCPFDFNPEQSDSDQDEIGNECDTFPDFDADSVIDSFDNCPSDFNPFQEDADDDGMGDECEFVLGESFILVGVYGDNAVELDDGSVWQVEAGTVFTWFEGEEVAVSPPMIFNLDAEQLVNVTEVGLALGHEDISSISIDGRFVDLDFSHWEIALSDQQFTQLWFPGEPVVVVMGPLNDFFLVRESDGRVVEAVEVP